MNTFEMDRRQFLRLGLSTAAAIPLLACTADQVSQEPKQATSVPTQLPRTALPVATSLLAKQKNTEIIPSMIRLPNELPYKDNERAYYRAHALLIRNLKDETFSSAMLDGIDTPQLTLIDAIANQRINYRDSSQTLMNYEADMYLYLGIGTNTINHQSASSITGESLKYMIWYNRFKFTSPRPENPALENIYGKDAEFQLEIEKKFGKPLSREQFENFVKDGIFMNNDISNELTLWATKKDTKIKEENLVDVAKQVFRLPDGVEWVEATHRIGRLGKLIHPQWGTSFYWSIYSNGSLGYKANYVANAKPWTTW